MLDGKNNNSWSKKLLTVRLALNTTKCDFTGQTAAYSMFGRRLHTADDIAHDIRSVVHNYNFALKIMQYLKKFTNFIKQIKDQIEGN